MVGNISFRQFVESLKVPNLSKGEGKRRYAMPQIAMEDIESFISWGKENQKFSSAKKSTVKTIKLVPTQSEFNDNKVEGMAESGNYKNKRILISSDNRVLDGHHTWLAAHKVDGEVKVIQFDKTVEEMMEIMKEYPKSFNKKLSESTE